MYDQTLAFDGFVGLAPDVDPLAFVASAQAAIEAGQAVALATAEGRPPPPMPTTFTVERGAAWAPLDESAREPVASSAAPAALAAADPLPAAVASVGALGASSAAWWAVGAVVLGGLAWTMRDGA